MGMGVMSNFLRMPPTVHDTFDIAGLLLLSRGLKQGHEHRTPCEMFQANHSTENHNT
jgi:hypothetical protein